MALPNFSSQLAQYSQAIANRKQRREIKRQREEAAAAARAAQNARSNRGLMGTLGGAAAAIGVGAATGFNPATMALAYQGGSALASGLNSIAKPYNQQEVQGLPYTQESGFETLNRVVPAVGSAYGAYKQQQAKLQQDEYSNAINNILNLTKIGDLNPAATTEMIGKLNDQHTAKYELDSPPSYMMDVSTLDSLGTGQKGWSAQKATFKSDVEGAIGRGDPDAIKSLQDSEMWNYYGGSYDEALKQAAATKSANAAKAKRNNQLYNNSKAEAERQDEKHRDYQEDKYLEILKDLPEPYFTRTDGLAKFQEEVLSKSSIEKDSPVYSKLVNAYNKKRFELHKPLFEETMKAALTSLEENKGARIDFESFRRLAVDQLGHSDQVARMLYENAIAKGNGKRLQNFYEDMNKLDLTNRNMFGDEEPRNPEVLAREIQYMGEIQGIDQDQINFAIDRMRNAIRPANASAQYNQGRTDETVSMSIDDLPYTSPGQFSLGEGGSNYSIDNSTAGVENKNTYIGDIELKYDPGANTDLKGRFDMEKGRIIHAEDEIETEGDGSLENQMQSAVKIDPDGKPVEVATMDPAQESADIIRMRERQLEGLKYLNDQKKVTTQKKALDLNSIPPPAVSRDQQREQYKIGVDELPADLQNQIKAAMKAGDPKEVIRLANIARESAGLSAAAYQSLLQSADRMNPDPQTIINTRRNGKFGKSAQKFIK